MSASAAAKYELKNPATSRAAELNIMSGTLGPDVLDISHLTRDLGVFTYDPGFMSTASTESKITYIDGNAGVLLYRGYPVEQLAEHSSHLEVADLLINGISRFDHAAHNGQRTLASILPGFPSRRASHGHGLCGGRLDGRILLRHDRYP
jgi:hypothetical protein